MPTKFSSGRGGTRAKSHFLTTRWTLVCRAGAEQLSADDERQALEELCRAYWYPLYVFVRRRGYDPHQSQDLTQAFFARLLEQRSFAVADRERGRFRSFLLAALNNFLASEWEHARRQKRGGGQPVLSLDATEAEDRFQHEPATTESAEKVFERRWIETLLDTVLARLAAEAAEQGFADRFGTLKLFLVEDRGTVSFAEMATRLGLTEAAVKGVVRRLRGRYRELVREEVAQTVASPDQVDSEIRYLMSVF